MEAYLSRGKKFIGESIILKFEYNQTLINYVKNLPLRSYDPDTKTWEIPLEQFPRFVDFYGKPINLHIKLKNRNNKKEIDIPSDYHFPFKPYPHQLEGIKFGLNHDNFLLADQQGCVDEDTKIKIRFCGVTKVRTIKQAYDRFQKVKNGKASDFMIRCLKEDYFGPHPFTDIVYSGHKECLKMTLKSGKFLIATPDHKVLTNNGYVELQCLKIGDIVLTNGTIKCKRCGACSDVITSENAKFRGYCKKCMYKYLRDCYTYKGIKRKIIKGYYFLRGEQFRGHHLNTSQGVPEHQYLAEQKYERKLDLSCEVVHHIDYNSLNNNLDNLVIMSRYEHNLLHSKEKFKHFFKHNYISKGKEMVVVPKEDEIMSIVSVGKRNVYDIKMKDPYRNFVANGIVVHNCGKTVQSATIACIRKNLYGYKHCLIICAVNGSKYNWKKECEKFTDEKAHILGTRITKTGKEVIKSSLEKLEDIQNIDSMPYFIITNKETLRNKDIVKELEKQSSKINMIVYDEIHLSKNHLSQQGKGLLKLDADAKIALSGTPILNNPLDTFIVMKWLGYESHSMTAYKQRYCVFGGYGGYEIVDYKNIDELKNRFSAVQLRRLKENCLNLPPKIYENEYLELTNKQRILYNEIYNDIAYNVDNKELSRNPLVRTIRLRQATAGGEILSDKITDSVKYDRCIEMVEELAKEGRKCLIFSNWVDVLLPLYKKMGKFNPALIIGETKDVEAEKTKLNTDPTCYCCLGTIGAMGTSHTLTGADTVIFLDEPWNRGTKEQCEDRCHRIGTTHTVNIITFICKDTIDERINEIVQEKGEWADCIVDGKVIKKSDEILKFLLS